MHENIPNWLLSLGVVLIVGILGGIANILNNFVQHSKKISIKYVFYSSIINAFVAIMVWFLMDTPGSAHEEYLTGAQMFFIGMAGGGGSRIFEVSVSGVVAVIQIWINNLTKIKP